jgi:hypothetical protein
MFRHLTDVGVDAEDFGQYDDAAGGVFRPCDPGRESMAILGGQQHIHEWVPCLLIGVHPVLIVRSPGVGQKFNSVIFLNRFKELRELHMVCKDCLKLLTQLARQAA